MRGGGYRVGAMSDKLGRGRGGWGGVAPSGMDAERV
jgi:hypothetical protein